MLLPFVFVSSKKTERGFWFIYLRFGPYFCQPVIAGLSDENKPFICTMDSIGAKYVFCIYFAVSLHF